MSTQIQKTHSRTLHVVGVLSGIAAGAWLGSAEAPVQLVTLQISPYVISAAMVMGIFVARWTFPTLLKGTEYVMADLKKLPHLIIWALLAGALWAVANTLTVFAIRDVGLAIAFPIWNSNSVVGLLWGCLLFNELKGAELKQWGKVVGGITAVVIATVVLGIVSSKTGESQQVVARGIIAALGAGLLWGTMYIPYRKAYISGMNPLSFVTVFTFGELFTVSLLSVIFLGGFSQFADHLEAAKPVLFWFFFGGLCWVIGDLFQQFAAKYIGIGRGIPLANTNQLWGLAWAALVYHNFAGQGMAAIIATVAGCLIMIFGAILIGSAAASSEEQVHWRSAVMKECRRYKLDEGHVLAAVAGEDPISKMNVGYRWWDLVIVFVAVGVFVMLAFATQIPPIFIDYFWLTVICIAALVLLFITCRLLYKHTHFS